MLGAEWSLQRGPQTDGAQASAPLPALPPPWPACSLSPMRLEWPPPVLFPRLLSPLPSAWGLCTLRLQDPPGSLPLMLWPGRGLPRSQSWWPIPRRRTLHPQFQEHLWSLLSLAGRLGISMVTSVSVLKEDSWRPLSWAVTSRSVPGLGPGQLGVEGGHLGPAVRSKGRQPPTHSALLPQSRLMRA